MRRRGEHAVFGEHLDHRVVGGVAGIGQQEERVEVSLRSFGEIPRPRARAVDRFFAVRPVAARIPSHRPLDRERKRRTAGLMHDGGDFRAFQARNLVNLDRRPRSGRQHARLLHGRARWRQEGDVDGRRDGIRIGDREIEIEERAGRAFRERILIERSLQRDEIDVGHTIDVIRSRRRQPRLRASV